MTFTSLHQNISAASSNDIDFFPVIQNDVDVVSVQKYTHSYNDIKIVSELQNDIDVVLVQKLHWLT